uniref:THAP domain-containing protein 11 n=1 Tax=Anas platyrhynchos platyrhynchos TaxID=8840 RepID=A0A493TFH0_ANAPP
EPKCCEARGPASLAMPGFTCCVPGCYNNSHRDKALHFYTFPKDEELRRLWLKNVSRAGVSGCFSTFQPTTGHRVCSEHFQGGRICCKPGAQRAMLTHKKLAANKACWRSFSMF